MVQDILAQTFTDWELIIVSNGQGQEPQLSILQQLKAQAPAEQAQRITIISEPQGGVSRARNIGIEHATAPWVTFVDADDRLTPNHLQLLDDATRKDEPEIVIGGYSSTKNGITQQIKPSDKDIMVSKAELVCRKDLHAVMSSVWHLLFSANLIQRNSLLFDVKSIFGEDTAFVFECLLATDKVKLIPNSGYLYAAYRSTTSDRYVDARLRWQGWKSGCEYLEKLAIQAEIPQPEIDRLVNNRRYGYTRDCVRNLFLPGCTLTYSAKIAEVRRIVFEDSDFAETMTREDRKSHGLFDRFLGFNLAYDLHSPRYLVFSYQFFLPIVEKLRRLKRHILSPNS